MIAYTARRHNYFSTPVEVTTDVQWNDTALVKQRQNNSPAYKTQSPRPITPYYRYDDKHAVFPGTIRKYFYGYPDDVYYEVHDHFQTFSGLGGYVLPSDADSRVADVVNSALGNAYDRVYSSDAGLAETCIEYTKSRTMVTNHAMMVARSLRALRRFRFQEAASHLGLAKHPTSGLYVPHGTKLTKEQRRKGIIVAPKSRSTGQLLASNYLAYRYGWMPLYLNVYGVMKHLYDRSRNRPPIIIARGRADDKWSSTVTGNAGVYPYNNTSTGVYALASTWQWKQTWLHSVSAEFGFHYRLDSAFAASALSLGITDPVSLAYELLPLSFVADWFLDVQGFLQQFSAFRGKTFLGGWKTVRKETFLHFEVTSASSDASGWHAFIGPKPYSTRVSKEIRRTVYSDQPPYEVRLVNGLNTRRLLDAISLIRVFTA